MANTFFRPSYSQGLNSKENFLMGKLLSEEYGTALMVRAGVNRSGTAMAWAGIIAWEPLGVWALLL